MKGYEILTDATMKLTAYWNVTPCTLSKAHRFWEQSNYSIFRVTFISGICKLLLNIGKRMEWKPTDVTILFVYCWISTCFGPTGPSSGEFVQLFTQPLVQFLYRSVRVLCNIQSTRTERHRNCKNQWLCEQLYELSWRWACGPETCRDPAIYE